MSPHRFQRSAMTLALGLLLLVPVLITAQAPRPGSAQPAAAALSPDDIIPFDAAVTRGTLPNGVTYYVRKNGRPANRVLLRLAVTTGSLDEADDQQGLAHMLEHMGFNGSEHFKPGELVSYFESFGARLGPHVNAYTSFTETVYMLELPTDRDGVVDRGLQALADFGGGLTLDPKEIDKERGVVIEEWRGGLGAASRIRDKQIPVLYNKSRYAERLPIGKPDILRTFKPERLRAFYDTYYRPDRMAIVAVGDMDPAKLESAIKSTFGTLRARGPAPPPRDAAVPLTHDTLVGVTTDPEATQSSVEVIRKRAHEPEQRVGDYRRDLVERLFDQMLNDRFEEIARRPDAAFLGAGASGGALSLDVSTFTLGAAVQDGHIPDGLASLIVEARRAQQFGFQAPELDRARKWMLAFFERAYNERDKTESGSYAQEYLNHFLEAEPSPGIAYEYRLVQQFLPGVTNDEVSALARRLLTADTRVVLAISPEKAGVTASTDQQLRDTIAKAENVALTPWTDTSSSSPLMATKPEPAAVSARREIADIGVTVVRFANGVEAWLKPTDFKNDQVLFALSGQGGNSLAPPEDYPEASLAAPYANLSGAGGHKALDLQKLLAGKLASASASIGTSTQGISGSASPAELETALQLLYEEFTAPGDDPDAFALLKKQLDAALVNRDQSPQAVFAEKVAAINSSNHYTAKPLTVARVDALDRAKMTAFYRQRFANAADFTFFMVGAFKTADAIPLVARYVGSLPSTGKPASHFKDLARKFPSEIVKARVEKGREPRSQTVISFSADPPADPMEQERIGAATDVLETRLRDLLREELGQTYTVSVNLQQSLPQRGDGHIVVGFGAAPENVDALVQRVLDEVKRLQTQGPPDEPVAHAKEAALRAYETSLKQNNYWLGRLQTTRLYGQDPSLILRRKERIEAVTPAVAKEMFVKYFPMDRYTIVTLMPEKSNDR